MEVRRLCLLLTVLEELSHKRSSNVSFDLGISNNEKPRD